MKRFGVSLPKEVAKEVDKMSQDMGVTRSEIVAAALQEYLEARKDHSDTAHQCLGVVLAISDSFSDIGEIIEDNRGSIVAYTHLHVDGKCLTIAVVRGSGTEVERLNLAMSKKAQLTRYVPLK